MHPAILFTARHAPEIAEWLFANRDRIGSGFQRFGEPIFDSLAGRSQGIDRIGNAIVAQRDGHREVIGLLHRHEGKLDGIGRAVDGVAGAVDGIAAGQAGLAASLELLTSLSAVALGFSLLTPAVLLVQFRAVHRRLDGISADVRAIKERLDIQQSSLLKAGLKKLENAGDRDGPAEAAERAMLEGAYDTLTNSSEYYAEHLRSEVGKGPKTDRQFAWVLYRHAAVAALGLAACHLRLGRPKLAEGALRKALPALRDHAAAVFDRTVGAGPSPMRFLMPAMKEHGVTLESMAELYRQASHAGLLKTARRRGAAEFFEDHLRGYAVPARDPKFYKAATVQRLRCELVEATAAIEEVNRIRGLALTVGHCATHGLGYLDLERQILADLAARTPAEGMFAGQFSDRNDCFAFFPTIPSAPAGDT